MLLMLRYRPFPGKAAEAVRCRQEWQENDHRGFRQSVKVIQELANPCELSGYLLLEIIERMKRARTRPGGR